MNKRIKTAPIGSGFVRREHLEKLMQSGCEELDAPSGSRVLKPNIVAFATMLAQT